MKVCVLQPDYSTTDVDYKNYDPVRNLQPLLPNDTVDTVLLNKLNTYKQLKDLKKQGYDIFVNLCEGYLDWSVPSIDVINSMDMLNLPYTGPTALLYDPPKALMKYVATTVGVATPTYSLVHDAKNLAQKVKQLNFPLFVKPAKAGDSLGVDDKSRVEDLAALEAKIKSLNEQEFDEILVEEYVPGREFTVLVVANANAPGCTSLKPVEYRFPKGFQYKTYALKTSELHTDVNFPCEDPQLEKALRSAAEKIFNGFSGQGYARMDFRVNDKNEIFFLEINFTCSVFYSDGYEGSADYILRFDPLGKTGFLKKIIEEGMARHAAKQKKYRVRADALNGYGIVSVKPIAKGEVIFKLETTPMRVVTKRFVEQNWNQPQLRDFRHYAYPISEKVYILWDNDPLSWAPQNHSCDPNTTYDGLNLIATRNIQPEEELTLDYAELLDENLEAFECSCGSLNCRRIVSGVKGNSITAREANLEVANGQPVV
jgi:D-alanine-D-alanine ligase-like ATP-grasp enzyme